MDHGKLPPFENSWVKSLHDQQTIAEESKGAFSPFKYIEK